MDLQRMAVFRKVPEGYIAFIEELPGANIQGASLEEARSNLREAVAMVIEANREMAREDADGGAVISENPSPSRREAPGRAAALGAARGAPSLREGENHTLYINRQARKVSTIPSAQRDQPGSRQKELQGTSKCPGR